MKKRPNNDIVDLQQLSGILTENKSSNTLYQNRIDEALPLVAPIVAGAAAAAKTLGPKLFQFLKKPKGVQKQGEPSLSKPVTPAPSPAAPSPAPSPAPASAPRQGEPYLNPPVKPSTTPAAPAPAPTPTPAPTPASAKSSNLELTVPTRNPGGSVGTDITGAAATSGRAPSMGQMLDKSAGPPGVTSTTKPQISSPPTGQAANIPNFRAAGQLPQAPTTMQPRPVAPAASATPSGTFQQSIISKPVASKPTVSTPKAVAAATALGTLAGAASDPDKTKELIDKIISSDKTKTDTKPEGQGQNTSSADKPTPASDAPATANTSTNSSSYNVKTGDTLGHIAQQYKTTVSNLIKDNPNLVDTESGKLKVIQPGQAINVSQTTDKDTNVWKDYDLDKLGTGSGKDVKESLKELKKLSGLIK